MAGERHVMCKSAFSILREISVLGNITLPRTHAKWRKSMLSVAIIIMSKAAGNV